MTYSIASSFRTIRSFFAPPRFKAGNPSEFGTEEQDVFEANFEEFLTKHSGETVLIQGKRIIGFFETAPQALAKGYELFGTEKPFLVKAVDPAEKPSQAQIFLECVK